MKVIRMQIDMVYQVGDEDAQGVYENDVEVHRRMRDAFEKWEGVRTPVSYELRHHMGVVREEEE